MDDQNESIVLACGCSQIKVNGKWFIDEYCKEHIIYDEGGFELTQKPIKKFRQYMVDDSDY